MFPDTRIHQRIDSATRASTLDPSSLSSTLPHSFPQAESDSLMCDLALCREDLSTAHQEVRKVPHLTSHMSVPSFMNV